MSNEKSDFEVCCAEEIIARANMLRSLRKITSNRYKGK